MAKINWIKVKTEYLSDPTLSYAKLADKYGVAVSTIAERAGREGWPLEKEKILLELEQKAIEKTVEKTGESIAEINAQHNKIGKLLIGQALEALNEKTAEGAPRIKPRSYRDVRESLVDGVAIQRKANQMDVPGGAAANVNIIMPDWYTKIPIETDEQPNRTTKT